MNGTYDEAYGPRNPHHVERSDQWRDDTYEEAVINLYGTEQEAVHAALA